MSLDDKALMAVFVADLDNWNKQLTGPLPSVVALRLIERGYPETLAVRVAMTPPFTVNTTPDPIAELPRPGREIAESIERNTPEVAHALLLHTREW